jgi:hypothetical protein
VSWIADAVRYQAEGHASGKIIINVFDQPSMFRRPSFRFGANLPMTS